MPLCPQITNTPITVTLTADFTVTDVVPVVPATTEDVADVVVLIDGKTKAYYQATAPTSGMTEGDIWFDTDDGYKLYYYTGSAWTSVQDTAIAAAQSAATAAQTTADGKNKIYRQGTTPTGTFSVGDLWFNTSNDNAISRWDGSTWVANTLGNNALASISANKITAGTIDASVITVSNINAGNISTGTLAAARIAAGSLDASKITAGTITATQISSSYVYAGTIAAGNITAGTVTAAVAFNAASGTFSGTVTANSGTIAGWILSSSSFSNAAADTFLYSNPGTDGLAYSTVGRGIMRRLQLNGSSGTTLGSNVLAVGGSAAIDGALSVVSNLTVSSYIYNPGYQVSTSGGAARINDATTPTARLVAASGSSIRFKKDIVDISTVSALDPKLLLQLPVKAFKYREDYLDAEDERSDVLVPGFIAEELDAIYPVAVDHDSQGRASRWSSDFVVPAMLSLIQDLYKEVQTLKGE